MEAQGKTTSRLAQMQMRYQQKQRVEMEQKRSELNGSRGLGPLDGTENGKTLPALIGNGKVRQMFVERRQRVTGIDKSYPLQPISKSSPVNSTRQKVSLVSTNPMTSQNANGNARHINATQFTTAAKSSPNANQFNDTDAMANRINRNVLSSKLSDDFIDNEPFPEIFSHLDEADSINNGRNMMNVGKQLASMRLSNNNNNNNNNGKLRPVIAKKIVDEPIPSLNGNKKLPTTTKPRAIAATIPPVSPVKRISNGNPVRTPIVTPPSRPSTQSSSPTKTPNRPLPSTPPPNCVTCTICGRHFNEDRIEKHITICQKTATKKRKIFDATKHRVQGTEAEQYVKKIGKATTQRKSNDATTKKGDWRRKHEEFIQAIRSAKQVQQHLAKGGKLSDLPPPPPSENPDYVQCPHCSRRFNETAAQRHIPKCSTFMHNKPKAGAAKITLAKKRF